MSISPTQPSTPLLTPPENYLTEEESKQIEEALKPQPAQNRCRKFCPQQPTQPSKIQYRLFLLGSTPAICEEIAEVTGATFHGTMAIFVDHAHFLESVHQIRNIFTRNGISYTDHCKGVLQQ